MEIPKNTPLLSNLKKRKTVFLVMLFIFLVNMFSCDPKKSKTNGNNPANSSLSAKKSASSTSTQAMMALDKDDFDYLIAYKPMVDNWVRNGKDLYFIFYAPDQYSPFTLMAYKHKKFQEHRDILDYFTSADTFLQGTPPGRYILGNLLLDKQELKTLHELPPADYEGLLFIPTFDLNNPNHVTYLIKRIEKGPVRPDTAFVKFYYDPIQANPSPPKEPS